MIIWQRIEGAIIFVSMIALIVVMEPPLPLWQTALLFVAPDLTFAAYLGGPRVGAFAYNLSHLYPTGLLFIAANLMFGIDPLLFVGLLFIAHAGFDRMLGYGLKSTEGFGVTHLGKIGKDR